MSTRNRLPAFLRWLLAIVVAAAAAATIFFNTDGLLSFLAISRSHAHGDVEHTDHDHSGHSHGIDSPFAQYQANKDGHTHSQGTYIELDQSARRNVGLSTMVVEPQDYTRTVSIPATVVERPGQSQVEITAPFTGVVTRVVPREGQAVAPGETVCQLRLTHEDLVTAQRNFLQAAEQLDVITRELNRLESIGEGVIAGKRLLEQKYEKQKLEAAIRAQRQGLLLHGLSEAQIERILQSRALEQVLDVKTPPLSDDHRHATNVYHVQKIAVKRGEHVTAGDTLAVLADHCVLYIEGKAFEDDAARLIKASSNGTMLKVVPRHRGDQRVPLHASVLYVADHVDTDSRALHFYLELENELTRDVEDGGERFIAWRYRPGMRMEVLLPIGETWENQIVLPADAVVDEGAESFVFTSHRGHFDRTTVHVLYRDKDNVVIANNGQLIGRTVAASGAYQLHLAIKNQAGGGVDPHAGHDH